MLVLKCNTIITVVPFCEEMPTAAFEALCN
jgi:hypothetical protein